MISQLRKFLGKRPYPNAPQYLTERELLQREAEVGASLFGNLGPGRKRQFFVLDPTTVVWYEEWRDGRGVHRVTTRYEFHADHVLKIQNDEPAVMVEGAEMDNLYEAVRAYYYAVSEQVYQRPIQQTL